MTAVIVRSYSPTFGRQVRAAGDEQLRRDLARDLPRPPLVRRVDRRPQEARSSAPRRPRRRAPAPRRGPRPRRAGRSTSPSTSTRSVIGRISSGGISGVGLVGLRDVEGLLARQARRAARALHDEDRILVARGWRAGRPGRRAARRSRWCRWSCRGRGASSRASSDAEVGAHRVGRALDRVEEPARAVVGRRRRLARRDAARRRP